MRITQCFAHHRIVALKFLCSGRDVLHPHLIRIGLALAITLLLTLNVVGFLEIPYLHQLEPLAFKTK